MAISPLDLQTLFTQVDKVGRQETAQKEGAALLQSIQNARHQEQTDEKIKSVNEAQDTGDGTEEINDHNGGRAREESGHHKHSAKEEEETSEKESIIRDPDLGVNIDVSL